MASVTLKQVGKRFGKAEPVLDGLDLDVRTGELLVLLGASGCGKSTTLRMIAGLEAPTTGEIEIDGRSVLRVAPSERGVAMVGQASTLYPHLTVRENLAFALRARRAPKGEIAARVAEAADMLGLGAWLDRTPGELSGGQRQRVALGRAVALRPTVWLLDEPLSHLDAPVRYALRSEFRGLHDLLGITTVYVTHDQEEAMSLGDRIAVMAGGRMQQIGAPIEVHAKPQNRAVAELIGSPPMNFLEGTVGNSGRWEWERDGAISHGLGSDGAINIGTKLVLGFRPQAARVVRELPTDSDWPACVASVGLLGDVADVGVVLGPAGRADGVRTDAVIRMPTADAQAMVKGERVSVRLDAGRACFFEPGEFGRRLASES